jgi:hypothetical protein
MSCAFYKPEPGSKTAYRNPGSHITLIVPAPVGVNPISSFSGFREQHRGTSDEIFHFFLKTNQQKSAWMRLKDKR